MRTSFLCCAILSLFGCNCAGGFLNKSDDRRPSQSWDQDNLKQNDNTCHTMVYHVDPETGLLVQCPPEAQ